MPSQSEIQKQITDRIIEGLKNGVVPWRKPWRANENAGVPANVVSRRSYSGINPILLDLAAMSRGYVSRYWGTYQQWASLGAQVQKRPGDVKPGCWGTQIVFYKQVKRTKGEDGEEKVQTFPILRYYTVFNIEQVDGGSVDHLRASADSEPSSLEPDFEPARTAIEATKAEIHFGGDKAFYVRLRGEFPHHTGGDYIQMPHPSQFVSQKDFISTNFHELVHWSGVGLGFDDLAPDGRIGISRCHPFSSADRAPQQWSAGCQHRGLLLSDRRCPTSVASQTGRLRTKN